jgi:hypothetical protein
MPHVQTTSDIRWRDHDTEFFSFSIVVLSTFYHLIGIKITVVFPNLVPFTFDGFWVVGFFHWWAQFTEFKAQNYTGRDLGLQKSIYQGGESFVEKLLCLI